ncbi:nisin leader peptide-processing serine protease NisP [Clostridium pasteurianum DSM 525 = ATCC 6013]|uniref:Nisin leader peptide-processing serine protease NisP n=1 Tax=Clostridium pasteurianum DSM 525 = ATCC 6013 TaxID=1262449 RepID=A0A0H3J8W0_CLOPA|nr:S8 family serine peptidase [Clostridium pasteurianum]AJA48423.1 nisin leader peptide-processing serine protease NisP [Clostridium pasteurianum DSM 525 = ATCC 6013]AJA52411.1 nisin leader peptide-processing serine protease NisP [Clostridium pasteurianum DSM 525 = ATCC 6013]ELP60427.1 nisin leader peptide-processing serine protease NisP [Clostridium pasteurianum DSM 525 = ATCC 6013]KRU11579.1 Subtilisin [Clostridium pasteurianum DSM 525 = ATCC 6013]
MKRIKRFIFILLFFAISVLNINAYGQEVPNSSINLIITYKNNGIDKNIESFISNSSGQVISEMPELGAIEVRCNPNLIPKLKNYSNVESISPDLIIKLQKTKIVPFTEVNKVSTNNADLFNKYQWDIKKVTNNGKSFNLQSGNHNVVVGIIDTGVDENHPDLKSNFLGGKNFIPKNFENDPTETADPNDIEDRNGHGTHVAGTIAGNGRIIGVAPNIGFKSYRVFNALGDTSASIIASAIIQATKDKVKVINLSIEGYNFKGKCFWTDPSTDTVYDLGNDMKDYSLYKKAIKYAVNNGVTVVASAGNDSLDCSNGKNITDYLNEEYGSQGFKYVGVGIEVPGDIKGVINVSATDENNTLASYSNYGLGVVDIAAPGGDMNFVNDSIDFSSMCLSTYLNNSYMYMAGTSMAAPKISATAALIISEYGNVRPEVVTKKIYKSAESLNIKDSNKYFGHGLVNAYNALTNY